MFFVIYCLSYCFLLLQAFWLQFPPALMGMGMETGMGMLRHPQMQCDSLRLHVMLQLHLVSGAVPPPPLTLQTSGCSNLFIYFILFISQLIRCRFTPRESGKAVS